MSILKNVTEILKSIDIDGETMEQLIREIGMEDNLLRQLALKADVDTLKQLIEEKERLEEDKIQIYNIETYGVVKVSLLYRGIEYGVEVKTYDDCDGTDEVYNVSFLNDGGDLHPMDPMFDELIDYVNSHVIGSIK
jgi:hypothetical protein